MGQSSKETIGFLSADPEVRWFSLPCDSCSMDNRGGKVLLVPIHRPACLGLGGEFSQETKKIKALFRRGFEAEGSQH